MSTLITEHKTKAKITEIIDDLCSSLKKADTNKLVVVCENPKQLGTAMRAEWGRRVDALRIQSASANSDIEIMLFESDIAIMESLTFESAPPVNAEADVLFARPEDLSAEPPKCDVLVLLTDLSEKTIHNLSHNMRKNGQIVMYG